MMSNAPAPSRDRLLVATCPTGFGGGGLGQHLAKVVSDGKADGHVVRTICQYGLDDPSDIVDSRWESMLFRFPPLRFRPDLRVWLRHVVFDRIAAGRIRECDTLVAFMGGAYRSFLAARAAGARRLVLEMPNSHPANVIEMHRRAHAMHPLEHSWMNDRFRRRVERELAMADEIRANSEYTAESAIRMGADPSKIVRRHLPSDPRFGRIERAPEQGTRTIVFVGSLSVVKGVPFLVDRFRELPGDDLRLVLFGGWSSRGMRRFLERARSRDPRISWECGDPARVLRYASLAVHPSWEDGWGYAPSEAMDAGLPVLVSDQTGMKERLADLPQCVLPTGNAVAWSTALARWSEGSPR